MASLLATSSVENGGLRSYGLSLAGHLFLIGVLFFTPFSRKRVYLEEIPRSVRLIASLDVPTPKPVPKPAPPKPAPRPKPKPKLVKVVAPAPPPPVKSRVQIPVKEAPPLIKTRTPVTAPSSLQDKLASRLSALETKAEPAPRPAVPEVTVPKVAPLKVPAVTSALPRTDRGEELVPLTDFPYSWYVTMVKDRIFSRWTPPSSYALGSRKITAVISFRITRDGKAVQIALKESSGHRLFDKSALAALKTLAALPPLPKDYKEDSLDVVIRFQSQNR